MLRCASQQVAADYANEFEKLFDGRFGTSKASAIGRNSAIWDRVVFRSHEPRGAVVGIHIQRETFSSSTQALDLARWKEPAPNRALQRALRMMVRKIEVVRVGKGSYTVRIWLPNAEIPLFRELDYYAGCFFEYALCTK
jgi:hypothetical protein